MRGKILFVAFCIFGLPLWSTPDLGNKPLNPTPYATVVYAGHTTSGDRYCQCGTPDCICDPGEQSLGQGAMPVGQPRPRAGVRTESDLSGAASLGMVALTLLALWLRLKL